MDIFISTFRGTLGAITPVFMIIIIAGVLVRRNVINQENVKGIAAILVNLLLPCLIFSRITSEFTPDLPQWWAMPLVAIAMVMAALLMAILLFGKEFPAKKNMGAVSSIHNAVYFVLLVGASLYGGEDYKKFEVYTFMFALGINPLIWSVGKYLTTDTKGDLNWKVFVTPPLIANVCALALVFTGLEKYVVGSMVGNTIELIGSATVPMANIILGATLGGITLKLRPYIKDAVKVVAVKLFLLPALTIVILYFMGMGTTNPILAKFLILQAAVAPAIAIVMQIRHYGGEEQKVSSIMLLCYIVSIATLPGWVALWECLQ